MVKNSNALHRLLIALFVFGNLGLTAELVLLEHFEDNWQRLPLALLGVSLGAMIWFLLRPGSPSRRGCRVMMTLLTVSGAVGLYHHLTGNIEFELELRPALTGLPLIWEALRGATPALAPGAMIQLGLIGWIATLADSHVDPS